MDDLDRIDIIQIPPEDKKNSSRHLYGNQRSLNIESDTDEDTDERSSLVMTILCSSWKPIWKHLNPFKAVFDDMEPERTDKRTRPSSSPCVELKDTFFDKTPTPNFSDNISMDRSEGPGLITTKADIHTEHEKHTNSSVAVQNPTQLSNNNKHLMFSVHPI